MKDNNEERHIRQAVGVLILITRKRKAKPHTAVLRNLRIYGLGRPLLIACSAIRISANDMDVCIISRSQTHVTETINSHRHETLSWDFPLCCNYP